MTDLLDIPEWRLWMGEYDTLIFILFLTIGVFFALIFWLRFLLRRSVRMTSKRCPQCGDDLRRVHQLRWVRVLASVLPLRTVYCRRCRRKFVRVKPLAVGSLLREQG